MLRAGRLHSSDLAEGRSGTARRLEVGLPAVVALGLSLVVLPVGYMMSHPFWLDEAWVAVGTRSPLSYIRAIAFSGPAGFALLLRIPVPGEQGLRIFPLVFSAAAVYAAFLFGRDLGWSGRAGRLLVGAMAGVAVLMSPWSLLRIDLKHYTAEAMLCLLLLWLTGRLESEWSRRRLVLLSASAAVFSLFGWATMFVSVGVFTGLAVLSATRREWDRFRATVAAGGCVATVFFVVWWVFIRPYTDQVEGHWEFAYLIGGPMAIVRETWWRFSDLMDYYPVHPGLVAALLVVGLGVIAKRKPATALAVSVTVVVAMVLGRLSMFPFLERRTSHYLLIILSAIGGVALAWIALLVAKKSRALGMSLAAMFIFGIVLAGLPWVRHESIPNEDVRSQVRYIEANRVEGDLILVGGPARYGFGYYWRGGDLIFNNVVHFTPRVVGDGVVLYAGTDLEEALLMTIDHASSDEATGTVWVVRSHLTGSGVTDDDWTMAYSLLGLEVESIPVGVEVLHRFSVE